VTASTKRPPVISSGKRGAAATNISSLRCTPLDPVDPEIRQRLILNTPNELLQTYTEGGLDIVEGDILTVSSVDYPIRAVGEWYWPVDGTNTCYLVLEDLKT
jgi:hypothetical protein